MLNQSVPMPLDLELYRAPDIKSLPCRMAEADSTIIDNWLKIRLIDRINCAKPRLQGICDCEYMKGIYCMYSHDHTARSSLSTMYNCHDLDRIHRQI